MKKISCILAIYFLIIGCHHRDTVTSPKSNTDTTAFFPVNDYIRTDIEEVQKTPYLIQQVMMENDQLIDSAAITKEKFIQLANIFLSDSITKPALHAQYNGALFHDLSTQSYTFTYAALNEHLNVRTVNVLLNDENNKLKSVFIAAINTADSVKEEKLTWKAGKSFRISRTILRADKEIEQNIFVNWNDK